MVAARRFALVVLLAALAAVAGAACGGGGQSSSSSSTPATSASSTDISGTYVIVQDSDGTKPKPGVTVTLVLDHGTLTVHAVSPDDELSDTGTYSISNGKMTIEYKDQGISAKDQLYKLDGDTLELPVKMFSEGAGSSTWKRGAAVAAEPTAAGDGSAAIGAPVAPGGISAFKADWSGVDVDNYATAAAMKTFAESVNDKHMTWEDAVKTAVARAKTFSDVTGVDVSPNGLNAVITYKDGRDEDLLTERMSLTEGGISAGGERASEPYVSARPVAAPAASCAELPATPTGGDVNTPRGRIKEPGREGIQNKDRLYGVLHYDPSTQPKPISSADSPPAGARRALLVAPLYDVPHPGPVYKGDTLGVGTWSGFRDGSGGNNIECISADLKRGGYAVETILGRLEKGKPVETGIDGLVQLTKKLTSGQYGVIYFMTHGAESEKRFDDGRTEPLIKLEMGTLSPDDRKAVIGEKQLRHEEFTTLEDAIREKILREAGLPTDNEELKRSIRANYDINGPLELWVTSDYFRLIRELKGLDFSNTMIIANACSSAANQGLVKAFDAKAFFGFERPPDLSFSSDAAQTIVDEVVDKVRSARDAWAMWVRYHEWLQAFSKITPSPRVKISILKAYGKSGVEYAPMTDQTVILIYKLRHSPMSGSSDITKGVATLKRCSGSFWSAGKKAPLGDSCRELEFGSHPPTDAEIADTVFEAGGGGDAPYGRWTLAD